MAGGKGATKLTDSTVALDPVSGLGASAGPLPACSRICIASALRTGAVNSTVIASIGSQPALALAREQVSRALNSLRTLKSKR